MGWENQYMHLVTTKPGLIVAEEDRQLATASKVAIAEKRCLFPKCYVELGSGSGMHLLRLAELNPDTLCIGFEIRFKRAFRTGEKAERDGLKNVLVLRTDAKKIAALFDEDSVDAYFVNYPDPWDKRRWLKNRLLSATLLETMHRTLKTGGFLRYKTDHHEYFNSTALLLDTSCWATVKNTSDLLHSVHAEGNIPTEFEYLFRSQERSLCMLEALKISAPL